MLEQGIVNHVTLVHAMRTTFAQTLFVDATNSNKVLVDPTKVYYYGLSQGGIFGTSVMAYEPTMTRAVLGVGARELLDAARSLARLAEVPAILPGAYEDALDDTMVLSLMQMRWDKTEGSGIANTVLAGARPARRPSSCSCRSRSPTSRSRTSERTGRRARWACPVLAPTPTTPWGLTPMHEPARGRAARSSIMDGGAPPAADRRTSPRRRPSMHDLTRTQPATRRQIGDFYTTGMIVNECTNAGACYCAQSACD